MHSLKKADFKLMSDRVYKFSYWKKVVSEKDKNHREVGN